MSAGDVLRGWFGPSRREIWRQFAEAVGGEVIPGRFWEAERVRARHGPWVVTLDTYAVSTGKTSAAYTRFRAPYVNPEGFRFSVRRSNWLTPLTERLGYADIKVGDPAFDSAFVVNGTDEDKVRRLFASDQLRTLLEAQPQVTFMVKDDEGWFRGPEFPSEVDELYFAAPGVIRDLPRLEALFQLFAATLDGLCRLGSAYARDPGVEL